MIVKQVKIYRCIWFFYCKCLFSWCCCVI